MNAIPSISSQIDEKIIFKVIDKHFSRLAPHYYKWINSWLIGAYENYADIDKYIILIYIINKDFIFFRKNGLIVDYDSFYKDKSLEVDKINISDISKDLQIPKESVRRKIQELEKSGVIKKTGKKIFLDRTAFITAKPEQTLREFSFLVKRLNELLVEEKITTKVFDVNAISKSIKDNFSFCWYQFYKFLFIYTNRWRSKVPDLETIAVGFHVLLNTTGNKRFRIKDLNMKNWTKLSQGADDVGVNAMSLSEITGIPRPTVVRKIDYLKKNDWIHINNKKLISLNIKNKTLTVASKMQELNIKDLSKFLHRVFNQIKVINSN